MKSRTLLVVMAALLSIVVASCTTTVSNGLPQTGPGYIDGVATPCGLGGADRRVEVRLTQHGRTVASRTVTGSDHFSFSEPRGWYVVSSDQGGVRPVRVQVVASLGALVNLRSTCK
jgi:hypothetical protein